MTFFLHLKHFPWAIKSTFCSSVSSDSLEAWYFCGLLIWTQRFREPRRSTLGLLVRSNAIIWLWEGIIPIPPVLYCLWGLFWFLEPLVSFLVDRVSFAKMRSAISWNSATLRTYFQVECCGLRLSPSRHSACCITGLNPFSTRSRFVDEPMMWNITAAYSLTCMYFYSKSFSLLRVHCLGRKYGGKQ